MTSVPSEKLHPTGREECGTVSWWIFECFCSASTMSHDENQWTVFFDLTAEAGPWADLGCVGQKFRECDYACKPLTDFLLPRLVWPKLRESREERIER